MKDLSRAERLRNVNEIFDQMIEKVKDQFGGTISLDAIREIKKLEDDRKKYLAVCQTQGVTLTLVPLKKFFESPHKP